MVKGAKLELTDEQKAFKAMSPKRQVAKLMNEHGVTNSITEDQFIKMAMDLLPKVKIKKVMKVLTKAGWSEEEIIDFIYEYEE